ncbi:MAG: hypothetical protein H7Z11_15770 [Verrucomicrobia bacterium]|nr:hypothetical protein [Leptolyngbya sp. ES-bin-22]
MAIYKPYKQGTMDKRQARVMAAVGDVANLRMIMDGTNYKSVSAVAALVDSLVEAELLQAIAA